LKRRFISSDIAAPINGFRLLAAEGDRLVTAFGAGP
jgi:hypothetical protein